MVVEGILDPSAQLRREHVASVGKLDILKLYVIHRELRRSSGKPTEAKHGMTGHLYLRRAADCQRCLVDLAVQPNDAPEPKMVVWLPDSGADVDAIGLDGLRAIDPYLEYNLADDSDDV